MKHIAIISRNFTGGGIEKVTEELINGFISKNNNVTLILFKNDDISNINTKCNIEILSKDGKITKISQIRPYFFANKLKKIFVKNNFDLVLSNLSDFDGMKSIALTNVKNLYTIVHNTQSKRRFKRHQKSGFSILKYFKEYRIRKSFENKNLICVSNGVKDDLLNNIQAKPKAITTIYNPFNQKEILEKSLQKDKNIPQEKYIIHVGRFEIIHKRQDILLKAYKKSNIKEKLVLLGDGEDKEKLINLVKELGIENKIIFAGFQKNPYNWIKNASLFVFSSDYEGFGNVLVESLILNTPVVSTNCKSGPSEILTSKLSNYLVPTGDIEKLSMIINKALKNYPDIKQEYINNFLSSNIIDKYLALIGE